MKRHEITNILSLSVQKHINPKNDTRIYMAREVSFDYATGQAIRVDFMQFKPFNNSVSGIEKGDFYCYEVKSSVEDFHSKNDPDLTIEQCCQWLDEICTDTRFTKIGKCKYKLNDGVDDIGTLIILISRFKQQSWLIPNLKSCPCGCRDKPLLMYEKDKLYFCGGPTENVFAICSTCGRHTEKSDIATTINSWNNGETIDVR